MRVATSRKFAWKNKYCFCVGLAGCLQRQDEYWVCPCSTFFVSPWIFAVFPHQTDREHKHYNNKQSHRQHVGPDTPVIRRGDNVERDTRKSNNSELQSKVRAQVKGELAGPEPFLISPHEILGDLAEGPDLCLLISELGSSTTNFLFTAQTNSLNWELT